MVSGLLLFLLSIFVSGDSVQLDIRSMERSDLPQEFPFQILHEGFAVLQVEISNSGSEPLEFDAGRLRIYRQDGKELKRATSTDLTPTVIKYYRGNTRGIAGEGHIGPRIPGRRLNNRTPPVAPNSSATTVSIKFVEQVKEYFEAQEISGGALLPGETRTGHLYVKSDKHGKKLRGKVVLPGQASAPF